VLEPKNHPEIEQARTYTEAERREHTERLRAMLEDDGDTWDLSDNDKAALGMALQAVELANLSVCNYCGHVGPKTSQAMVDHVLTCEKRPEMRLFNHIDALRAYVRHEPMCSQSKPWRAGRPLHHCSCGLDELLAFKTD
jgi:NADH pyrophosphatase NudC (nudix superfamily)